MSNSSSVDHLRVEVTVFNTFSFLGVLSLALVAAAAHFSPTVHRSELWFRHIFSWIVYSTVFLFLLGHQGEPSPPPFGLCLVQAALIYAVPIFPTLSAFGFVADLYIGLSASVYGKRKIRPALTKILITLPQIVFLGVFIEALVLVHDPGVVGLEASHLYCHVTTSEQSLISGGIIVATGLLIVPLEIWIAVVLYRNWSTFRSSSGTDLQFVTMFIHMTELVGFHRMLDDQFSGSKEHWRLQ
ncbi:hypothetical protein B0H17DRAFT_1290649 [Mycena rosella]|uniref:Uncharacterized protein n=1 Tax=Mycena rosella TaxID=1033263 RepID=A0AAD7DFE8_MYCRO|nr:hypothetical protein B0H17DRAFT_1290649 [Mycena rosella]